MRICAYPGCGRPLVSGQIPAARRPAGTHGHCGRGLCGRCHYRAEVDGTLLDFPSQTRSCEEALEESEWMLSRGLKLAEIAERMGMTHVALERARARARAKRRVAA